MIKVVYTKHALDKFIVLARKNFLVKKSQVRKALIKPDKTESRENGTIIASLILDSDHLLRVVFKLDEEGRMKVITFYPARRRDYGI